MTLFTPTCAICRARQLALTPPSCTLTRTSLLSFQPLALPKQVIGTSLVKTFPFLFLFFVMFLHFSAHNFGAQRVNFTTQRSSLNNCFSCHVMSIVSTSSCFQFILEPLNHVVRQHVRALNARASAPPQPLNIFFNALTSKGHPNSLYSGTRGTVYTMIALGSYVAFTANSSPAASIWRRFIFFLLRFSCAARGLPLGLPTLVRS